MSTATRITQTRTDPAYLVTDADGFVVGSVVPTARTVTRSDAGLGVTVDVPLYTPLFAVRPQPLNDEDALNDVVFAVRIGDVTALPLADAIGHVGGCRITALELS